MLQITGGSEPDTPSTLTGEQIQARVAQATMSQTTDSFEETERMSEEPLEYVGEPHDQPHEVTTLTPELDRIMGVPSHFDEPEGSRARATTMETIIHLEPQCHGLPDLR